MIHQLFWGRSSHRYLFIIIALLTAVIAGYTVSQADAGTQVILFVFVTAGSSILIGNRWIPLVLLMALSFFSRGVWNVWGDLTVADLLLGYMGIRVALAVLERKSANVLRGNRLSHLLLLWVALVIAGSSVAGASFPASALMLSTKAIVQQVEYFILCAYLVYLFDPADIKALTRLEMVFGLGLACIVLYEATYGTIEFIGSSKIFGNTYNLFHHTLSLNTSVILLFAPTFWLVMILMRRVWIRLLLLIALLYTFSVSTSRALYLVLATGVAIYLRFAPRSQRWISVVVPIILVGFVVWPVVVPEIEEVFLGLSDFLTGQDRPGGTLGTTLRIRVWVVAFRVMLKSPLVGTGVGGFGLTVNYDPSLSLASIRTREDWLKPTDEYGGRQPGENLGIQAHSQYFQILADHGILGLALFLFFLQDMWKRNKRAWQNAKDLHSKQVSLALLVSYSSLLFGLVAHSLLYRLESNLVQLFFWYNIALVLLLEKASSTHDPDLVRVSACAQG